MIPVKMNETPNKVFQFNVSLKKIFEKSIVIRKFIAVDTGTAKLNLLIVSSLNIANTDKNIMAKPLITFTFSNTRT